MKKTASTNKSSIQNYNPHAKPIRFKRLTLETEDGVIFEVPGLQIREMSVTTPMEMTDGPGVPKGQFIKTVGPQEVTIVFQTFGINWPNRTKYAVEEEIRNLTPKSLQLPPPKQLPEHK